MQLPLMPIASKASFIAFGSTRTSKHRCPHDQQQIDKRAQRAQNDIRQIPLFTLEFKSAGIDEIGAISFGSRDRSFSSKSSRRWCQLLAN
jgi:hypothetical protein